MARILRHVVFVAFGLSGASALVFEVVWTRTLSTVMGSSSHALSTMLAAFMAGLSLGGALGALGARKVRDPLRAFALCELGIGVAGLAVAPLMRTLTPIYIASYYAFHESFAAFYAVQFLIAFVLMGIPTTLMGMTFPLVVRLFAEWRGEAGRQAGRLYAVNTLGGIGGALAAGFLLVPALGSARAAAVAATLNVVGALAILALHRGVKQASAAAAVAGALGLAVASMPIPAAPTFSYGYASRFATAAFAAEVAGHSADAQVLFHHEGSDGEVWVLQSNGPAGERVLVNGSKLEAGEAVAFGLLAQLPLATAQLMRTPRDALNIGLGSGVTLRALAAMPLESIDAVELSEGILAANRQVLSPDLFADPRIRHLRADGRNHLLVHRETYDVIVVSPSWAVEEASAAMLTREFFTVAAHHLGADGVIGVWVDLTLMEDADMSRVLRAFASSFRHVTAWRVPGGDAVLIGTNGLHYPPEAEVARLVEAASPATRGRFEVALSDATARPESFEGAYDDDRPIVEFNNARNLIVGRLAGR